MSEIRNVKLEILRAGPAHNQLLSPLTPYLALCGAEGPASINLPFEHRQLLTRIARLRYEVDGTPIAASQREAEARDLGEAIGRVLAQVPALLSELSNARSEGGSLVHLRLSLSAFELGLVPFELAIAPEGFPGSGSPLFLQSRTPITVTREIRRGQPLPLTWNRKPRILFAFASPKGLAPVPAQAHLVAIRRAIEPWVRIRDKAEDRVAHVKAMLTVMPEASLERVREACASTEYTHVHILAHGAEFDRAQDRRFGVALCSDSDPSTADVVDGERLAIALTSRDSSGRARHWPTVVTLATCDSGNINSVLTPGGSIAHELHAAGIPWVIASQFPLWMRASSIAAEVLYRSLLDGSDPRWALHELRQRLRTDAPGTHDWASIVAYATVPWDFEQQVYTFRATQVRRKLDVKFDRIDELVGANEEDSTEHETSLDVAAEDELRALRDAIRSDLAAWRGEQVTIPRESAERLGMSAASEKRIGIAYALAGKEIESREAYGRSRDFYRAALEVDPSNHWVITQYLSMLATPSLAPAQKELKALAKEYGGWWTAARQIAAWQLPRAEQADRAWALATLAELAMLGAVYGGTRFDSEQTKAEIVKICAQMRELLARDAFPIFSTQRQFRRYVRDWPRTEWGGLAEAALRALGGG